MKLQKRISHHLLQREQLPAGPGARISVSCLSSERNVHLHELEEHSAGGRQVYSQSRALAKAALNRPSRPFCALYPEPCLLLECCSFLWEGSCLKMIHTKMQVIHHVLGALSKSLQYKENFQWNSWPIGWRLNWSDCFKLDLVLICTKTFGIIHTF